MKICSVDGCGLRSRARGYCKKHYKRWIRHGDRNAGATFEGDPQHWILGAVAAPTEDCMEWPYARFPKGYGSIQWEGKTQGAHRVVCELAHGAPPNSESHAAHRCGNPPCCNPNHLKWASPSENNKDKESHGTAQRGSRAPNSRLTEHQVRKVRQLLAIGVAQRSIASELGVHQATIHRIKTGKSWAHFNHGNKKGIMRQLSESSVRRMAG